MHVRWWGHSCFSLASDQGTLILTDPFEAGVGYPLPQEPADLVTISHDHWDHNAAQLVAGTPAVIREPGIHRVGEAIIEGIPSFHDEVSGKKRGSNIIFLITLEGIRICHLGDLGHMLTPDDADRLGEIDLLLLPVGGRYTIDGRQAWQLAQLLNPRIVVPMHYQTPALSFSLDPVETFTRLCDRVEHRTELAITAAKLPDPITVIALDYR